MALHNIELNAEECDARMLNSSNTAGLIKKSSLLTYQRYRYHL